MLVSEDQNHILQIPNIFKSRKNIIYKLQKFNETNF